MNIHRHLLPAVSHLEKTLREKAAETADVCKTGRTHLMDAMPVMMGQEISGWAEQVKQSRERIEDGLKRLILLPQGGTAVGTGVNAHHEFAVKFNQQLSAYTGITFKPNPSFFMGLSSQDSAVEMSGHLKSYAVALMKISNDLRWMNSGPLAGLAEIELQALQPGSSIMPGKVNPVIPEAVTMVCAQVIGNDTAITVAGQSGNFQLNVMLPVIADNLLYSISLIANASVALADKAVKTFRVSTENLEKNLAKNPILATALNPVIGYMKAAEIVKKAYKEKRTLLEVALEMTDLKEAELLEILDPRKLTKGANAL
ncbi:hypothetical protein CHS0354_018379 [Potamilus streckersoni]|uniref:fumarate hydratase n=1 Tax=Potamilus streckersoni TaxID=2493646 RepID=A0AAE0TAF8_9BIVA|nr:hypothetical protein CHS0354_018379 [Potamilus streckersoni]